jgi:beta-mannosidase
MKITLNGNDWFFKDFYGEDWRWRNSHKPDTRDIRHWRQGSVPGSVHNDLWAINEIPNPYFERNSLLLEWIPARTWLYKKSFQVDSALHEKRIHLCFEGVDYEAEFFLNGQLLGTHRGMYTPIVFELSEKLLYGEENLIAIVIASAPHEQPQVGRTSAVRTHKSRMNYWWDFCPRMIHLGIWDDVFLEISDSLRIEDIFVQPRLSPDFHQVHLAVNIELDSAQNETLEFALLIRLGAEIIAQKHLESAVTTGQNRLSTNFEIKDPQLWYPNGYGAQPLYDFEIVVYRSGTELAKQNLPFGIRKVELIANENSEVNALPYTLVVNDRKIYIKGWNWVPIDVMYGVPRPEKLQHLLRLAQSAHVNLLRIWGGGLIEKEAFYKLCDQMGILVWQEFIQSSSGIDNHPSDSPEMIEMLVKEVEQIIPRKRNHPSLAIWCGGNELQAGSERPLNDNHPLLAALKATVNRLDPERIWLATSPTGRVFSNSLENIEADSTALHDVHGPWEYQGVVGQYTLYNQGTSLLHSEFGVEGITNLKSLNATISKEHQWPVNLDNIYWFHLGAWWVKQKAWEEAFGIPSDVESWQKATQFMQADALRYALEADRRRKFHNSGTLPWQFNEPYPMAACTSAVDYYGQPKPNYYAVAQAYEPVHLSAKFPTIAWAGRLQFEAEIWLSNSHDSAFEAANLEISLLGQSGKVYAQWNKSLGFPANSSSLLSSIEFPLGEISEEIFFLDMHLTEQGRRFSDNRYTFTQSANLAPLLSTSSTEIVISKEELTNQLWKVKVSNIGTETALFVWLEDSREVNAAGFVYFAENYFCLFPDESKEVEVSWHDVPAKERSLQISAWNTITYQTPKIISGFDSSAES